MFHLESFHDPWQAEGSETVNHVIQNDEYSNFMTLFVEKNKSSTKQSNRSKKKANRPMFTRVKRRCVMKNLVTYVFIVLPSLLTHSFELFCQISVRTSR